MCSNSNFVWNFKLEIIALNARGDWDNSNSASGLKIGLLLRKLLTKTVLICDDCIDIVNTL